MAKERFDYFDAFCKQTEYALQEVRILAEAVETFTSVHDMKPLVDKAHEIEHAADQVNHSVMNQVAIDFITPFEREDIVALVQCLDSITDSIEDVMQSFYMFDVHKMHPSAPEMVSVIAKSIEALDEAMREFKNFKKAATLRELIIAVNDAEEEGDHMYIESMHRLFKESRDDALFVHVWSTLFARMEKCTDAAEHAADVMGAVVLKNS